MSGNARLGGHGGGGETSREIERNHYQDGQLTEFESVGVDREKGTFTSWRSKGKERAVVERGERKGGEKQRRPVPGTVKRKKRRGREASSTGS